MATLHQFRCFLAAYEQGSFTAAAQALGYAQPSLSEQIRLLERSVGTSLFTRVGRGVAPTSAAEALRPHAEASLDQADQAVRAATAVRSLESGTIRFGIFGTSRLYLGAELVADVLQRHPNVRVELIGQNSAEVHDLLRSGRIEAAMIALPVADEGLAVRPIAREEMVYISADPSRLRSPVTARQLADATLVLPETTWRHEDSGRRAIAEAVQKVGRSVETRIEVEDVETAVELVGQGLADSVVPRGALTQLLPRLSSRLGFVSLRPKIYDMLAVVHRKDAALSPAATLMIELATARIRSVTEPLGVV